jgi:hypothetical protein
MRKMWEEWYYTKIPKMASQEVAAAIHTVILTMGGR